LIVIPKFTRRIAVSIQKLPPTTSLISSDI
jgi:hypothetical protein